MVFAWVKWLMNAQLNTQTSELFLLFLTVVPLIVDDIEILLTLIAVDDIFTRSNQCPLFEK